MIVVAIIGILAAVAIPGFMKYIKDSKTTEAKTNIKAIAEGASAFFQTEHASDANGEAFFTHQYPSDKFCKAQANGGDCAEKGNSQTAIQDTGTKAAGDFADEPWPSLNVAVTGPVYYVYSYQGTAGDDTAGSTYDAQAAAKLDSATNVDSCFAIHGGVNAAGDSTFGTIVDKSENTDANKSDCDVF